MVARKKYSDLDSYPATKAAMKEKLGVTNLEENQVTGVEVYDTYTDEGGGDSFLPLTGTPLVSYKVSNDPDSSNNGYYHWTGSVYVKDANLDNGSVQLDEVEAVTGDGIFKYINDFKLSWIAGIRINADGSEVNHGDWYSTDFIPIYKGSEIWFEGINQHASYGYCCAYDKDFNFVEDIVEKIEGGRFETMSSNSYYIRLCNYYPPSGSAVVYYKDELQSKSKFISQFEGTGIASCIDLTGSVYGSLSDALGSVDFGVFPLPKKVVFQHTNGENQIYFFTGITGEESKPEKWVTDSGNSVKEKYLNFVSAVAGTGENIFTFELDEPCPKTTTAYIPTGAVNMTMGIERYDTNGRRTGSINYSSGGYTEFTIEKGTRQVVLSFKTLGISEIVNIYFNAYLGEEDEIVTSNIFDKSRIRYGLISINVDETDFDVTERAKTITSDYIPVNEGELYVFGYNFETGFYRDQIICYLDENKDLISFENYIAGDVQIEEGWRGYYATCPAGCKYVLFTVVNWDTIYDNYDSLNFIFCKYNDLQEALIDEQESEATYPQVKESYIRKTTDLSFWVLGDSISASGYDDKGRPPESHPIEHNGAWCAWFIDKVRPRKWFNYAAGGHTLSDDSYTWAGGVLSTTDNSFIKKLEEAIVDYNAGTIDAPDWLMIVGCTNDMDTSLTRYVTDAEVGSNDYDSYMEENFMTTYGGTYDTTTLVDIEDVNLTKIAGAIRYIVERIGTLFPDCKFLIVTPYFDTAHSQLAHRKCVSEMRWMADRLSIPQADVQKESNMTMLWDYKLVGGAEPHKLLADRVHPFSPAGTTAGAKLQGDFIANRFLSFLNRLE